MEDWIAPATFHLHPARRPCLRAAIDKVRTQRFTRVIKPFPPTRSFYFQVLNMLGGKYEAPPIENLLVVVVNLPDLGCLTATRKPIVVLIVKTEAVFNPGSSAVLVLNLLSHSRSCRSHQKDRQGDRDSHAPRMATSNHSSTGLIHSSSWLDTKNPWIGFLITAELDPRSADPIQQRH